MSKTTISIQQWVDALPPPSGTPNLLQAPPPTTSTPHNCLKATRGLVRDASIQSDDASSHCSSVESVLDSRRPDPEAVLLGLGFGPPMNALSNFGRVPPRFLKPSKLIKDLDFTKFLEQQGEIRFEQTYGSLPPSPAKHQSNKC